MAFCTNCGKPVSQNQNFCGACGARLNQSQTDQTTAEEQTGSAAQAIQTLAPASYKSETPASAYPSETIRVVLPNFSEFKPLGRSDIYNLVITDHRSIFAKLTQQIINETIKARRARATAEGKGFFGRWAAQMKIFNTYSDHYNGMTPEQVLNETTGNFAIDNASITQIKIRDEDEQNMPPVMYTVEMTVGGDVLKFRTNLYDPSEELSKAFPGLVVK